VPGTWERDGWPQTPFEGLQARGTGGSWEGLQIDERTHGLPATLLKNVDRTWYEREITIPQNWAGREIVLDVQRVSTDARVFIDGKEGRHHCLARW
jgi:beta-galactosidase